MLARMKGPGMVILVGLVMVLVGASSSWLMALGSVKSSYVLCFLSYGASMAGLMLGMLGTALKMGSA